MEIQQIFKSAGGSVSLGTTRLISPGIPWKIQQIFKSAGGSLSLGTTGIISPETPWKFKRFLRVLEEVCL
jgi:hypothetical protein